jgi:hypothetical protein
MNPAFAGNPVFFGKKVEKSEKRCILYDLLMHRAPVSLDTRCRKYKLYEKG